MRGDQESGSWRLLFATVFTLMFPLGLLKAQYDLTENGRVDLALTVQKEGEPIIWFAYDPVSKEFSNLGEFGQTGWSVNVAPWLDESPAQRGYVRKLENSEIRLKVEGVEEEFRLGEYPYQTRVIAGRRIDKGGLADLAVVYQKGRHWHWKLFLNPFSEKAKVRNFRFGSKATMPFLYRHRGRVDSVATLKVRKRNRGSVGTVRFRSLRRKKGRRFRVRGVPIPDTPPRLIRSGRGRDELIFLTPEPSTESILLFRVSSGNRRSVTPLVLQRDSQVFIGDYSSEQPGEELLIYSESRFFQSIDGDDVSGGQPTVPDELIDNPVKVIGIDSDTEYQPDVVSDLPIPTKTATVSVENTPAETPSPVLSATATLSLTEIAVPTFTSSPTQNPSLTATAVASPTRTIEPTATFTGTPSPTVTSTPTVVNVAPTDITLTNNSVAENSTAANIGTLGAVDSNPGDSATFTLTSDPSGQLEIDGTTLKLQSGQALDFETQGAGINIQVTVTDGGGLTYAENFTVLPTNQNEAPTAITLTSNSVTEKTDGDTVGTLGATDPDSGDTFSYAIIADVSAKFEITGGNTLKLQTAETTDFGVATSHDLTLRVTDGGALTFDQVVTVSVVNTVDFTNVVTSAEVDSNEATSSTSWADYDNDGDLDLFLTTRNSGQTSILYQNDGDGTFTNATASAGITSSFRGVVVLGETTTGMGILIST